jgi:hypothetical protein
MRSNQTFEKFTGLHEKTIHLYIFSRTRHKNTKNTITQRKKNGEKSFIYDFEIKYFFKKKSGKRAEKMTGKRIIMDNPNQITNTNQNESIQAR